MDELSSKHRRVLESIFANPVPATVKWDDAMALVKALGGEVLEREGSRAAMRLNGRRHGFHKPHEKEMCKAAVRDLRDFLEAAGVSP